MNRHHLKLLALLLTLTLALAGCASTGAGPGEAAAPDVAAEPKVDIRNEMGDNGLLTPAAILARYVDALGGEKAVRGYSSSTTKGQFVMEAMGLEGDTVIYAAAPNHLVLNIEFGGMGTMNQGYNGEIGWSDNPMQGPSLLEGDLLNQMLEQADFYRPLNYDTLYPTQETVEVTEFNGEEAYKMRLLDPSGKESFHFFSKESSLLVGTEGVQTGPMGEAPVTTLFGGYKDFGGLQVPTTTTIKTSGMEIKQLVSEVTYDDVDSSAFEPPDSIKALLK